MSRQGIALVLVLWLMVAIGATAVVIVSAARQGVWISTNRIRLVQGEWAATGCLELLASRGIDQPGASGADSIGLGGLLSCKYRLTADTALAGRMMAEVVGIGGPAGATWSERVDLIKSQERLAIVRRQVQSDPRECDNHC